MLEDQVVDHIMESAEVEEVVASYTDVISGVAIAPPAEEDDTSADETEASTK